MEAASTCETLVNFYENTQRNIPEDRNVNVETIYYKLHPYA